jgi:hypothetical protein
MFLQRSRRRSWIGTKVGIAQYRFDAIGSANPRRRNSYQVARGEAADKTRGSWMPTGFGPIQPPDSHRQLLNSIAYNNDLMPDFLSS